MNFLSHFYFDRHFNDPERILGTVLPDLIKNANKSWNIHPEKRKDLSSDNNFTSIMEGWNRHLEVDRQFHCSDFFLEHTRAIRISIVPVLENSPVRPSFLSHIALELMLDSLLITEGIIDPEDFYKQLRKINRPLLTQFLEWNNINDSAVFFEFFDSFINSAYLKTYSELPNIMYALNRICMRLWNDPLNEEQKSQLTLLLLSYHKELQQPFPDIFKEINAGLE